MIADIIADIIDRLKGITEFNNRVMFGEIGGDIDPTLRKLVLPAAVVVYTGDELAMQERAATNRCATLLRGSFIVKVLLTYDDDATRLGILEEVIRALNTKTFNGSPYVYEGSHLEELTKRQVFEMRFTISYSV